jgi:pimeloyl-ACP methyl ester carboxylesterase
MQRTEVNGADLSYEQLGDGPSVLLIHGTGACVDIWGDVPQRLSQHHRVIAYDRRGFGASSGPLAKDLDQQVADAAALLDQLGASPATVVGWSGGGVIALMLAHRHPDKVASLVLAEPALHLSTHPTLSSLQMTFRNQVARRRGRQGAAAAIMYRWVTPPGTAATAFDDFPARWREQMIDNAPATLREMDQQMVPKPRRRDLASIRCPVTVMVSDLSDSAFPRVVRFLRRARPETEVVALEGAGHTPHLDRPELWVQTVARSAAGATAGRVTIVGYPQPSIWSTSCGSSRAIRERGTTSSTPACSARARDSGSVWR